MADPTAPRGPAPGPGATTFEQVALNAGVLSVLVEDYGLSTSAVDCPADQVVEVGLTFTCTAVVEGEEVVVDIEITDADGTYQVGRP